MSDTELKISVKYDQVIQALNNIQNSLKELVTNAQKPIEINLNGEPFVKDAKKTFDKVKEIFEKQPAILSTTCYYSLNLEKP